MGESERIYSIANDMRSSFKEQKAWLELGALLSDSFSFNDYMLEKKPKTKTLKDEIKKKQKAIQAYYDYGNDNGNGNGYDTHPLLLFKYIANRKDEKKIDWRIARIISYLVYHHFNVSPAPVSILRLARACNVSGGHDETMENRRIISCLCLDDILKMYQDTMRVNAPDVCLSRHFISKFGGGKMMLADVCPFRIAQLQESRKARESLKNPKKKSNSITQYVESLPNHTPSELCNIIRGYGVVGQETAKRDLSLLAYRHVQRLRSIFLDGVKYEELPEKQNALLIGGTGTGKTFLASILFKNILGLPSAILDMTTFTESGYVGESVESIPTSLIIDADDNVAKAEMGVFLLDEIDKISQGADNRQSMVSRNGVQRSLLKLLEPTSMNVPETLDTHNNRTKKVPFKTHNTLCIGLGCFDGMDMITKDKSFMGFNSASNSTMTDSNDMNDTADAFCKYGFSREMFGRLHNIIHLDPLTTEDMRNILVKNVIAKYKSEMDMGNLKLTVNDDVVDAIVEQAIGRGTGARGLTGILSDKINGAYFEALSGSSATGIELFMKDGAIGWAVKEKRGRKMAV